MKHGPITFAATLLAISSSGATQAADLGTKEGQQWFPYLEWTLPNPTSEVNPFDLRGLVEFKHDSSGEVIRTEMFYAGNQRWAFRFTGTLAGNWSFTTSSDDEDLDGHGGKVTINRNPRSNAHGFLRKFETKWGWQGTETAFIPQLVMWDYIAPGNSPKTFHNKPGMIERLIQEFIVEHGFSGFHLPVVGGRWFDINAESDAVEESMTEPDLRTFEAIELLITKTHGAGGVVHIWPWGDHQREQTPRSLQGGRGGRIDQRWQRYVAARLGPIPGWSMGYGFDLDEYIDADELEEWRDTMHQYMGWPHFLGGRPEGPNHGTDHASNAKWNEGLDYSSYEHHRPSYEVYLAAVAALPGQPVMSEDRFRIRESRYPEKDYSPDRLLQGLYHSTMAGGVGNIWGIDPELSAGGVFPNKEQIKTWSVFFHEKGRFLADMRPANNLTTDANTCVLESESARSMVVYRESAKSVQIDLSGFPGALPALAVDIRKTYEEVDLGKLLAEKQTIALPVQSDWVIAVGSFKRPGQRAEGSTAPPAQLSFSDIRTGPALHGGHGAMWADADADQLPDLYLPLIHDRALPDLFLHNKGEGVFTEEGARRGIRDFDGGSHGAAWCDLDNDGDYDLINGTTSDDGGGIHNNIFRNNGRGRFVEVTPRAMAARQAPTRAFLSFDLDGDGDLDLFGVSNYQGSADPPDEHNELYRNEGDFNFSAITTGELYSAPAGQGATDTDFDGDGDIDILAANRTGALNILQNDGQGNFRRIVPESIGIRHAAGDGITSADVDNDRDLDLLLATGGGDAHLYLNNGGGTFTHAQSFPGAAGYMGGFADLDQDGDLDLYFAGDSKVFLNDGAGGFVPGPSVPATGVKDPRGVAFADIDNDGDLDIAFGDKRAGRNYLLRNDLTSGGNWLKVRLVAANGQAGAFGAKIAIYEPGQGEGAPLALRESQSNCGYLGQNDPVLHFGLGPRASVNVTVKFLDGSAATRKNVPANQTLVVTAKEDQVCASTRGKRPPFRPVCQL